MHAGRTPLLEQEASNTNHVRNSPGFTAKTPRKVRSLHLKQQEPHSEGEYEGQNESVNHLCRRGICLCDGFTWLSCPDNLGPGTHGYAESVRGQSQHYWFGDRTTRHDK